VHAHHQHRPARELALYAVEEVQAASSRHGKIEHCKVPFERARKLERLVTVGRLADNDHGGIGFQDLTEPAPHDRMIVRNQYFHGIPSSPRAYARANAFGPAAHRKKV
jgi:hypothetical protein